MILIPISLYFWPTTLGGDTEVLIVQGQSMLPTIHGGSLVITKKAPSYHVDDIVSFVQEEEGYKKFVVHRIIEETEEGFVMKGDNNPFTDPGIQTAEAIHGKVIFATPYVGDLFGLLRNPIVLLITGVVWGLVQAEQKRRRKKKEKLRRIRLGLPAQTTNLLGKENKEKSKKPDYSVFFGALTFNVLTYVLVQFSILYQIQPKGDMVTGFLFRIFAPSFASTLAFGLYFLFIFGLYFLSKIYEVKILKSKPSSRRKSLSMQFLVGKDFNPMLAISQFLWFLFIMMSIFHLIATGQELYDVLTCDPTKELC